MRSGRSPQGRVRNFRAMGNQKLLRVYTQVMAEGNDPQAENAAFLALRLRNLEPLGDRPLWGGQQKQYAYPDELTAEDRVEVEGLLDALIG